MVVIEFLFPPLQQLADYVFDAYKEFDEHCNADGNDADRETCVICHQKAYWRTGKPKYDCNNFKRVYLWRYFSTHVAQTEHPLLKHVSVHLGKLKTIKALSVGGGPGTEAIALMDQLNDCDGYQNITFHNLEYEQSWEPIYLDLVNQFAKYVGNVSVTPKFRQFDASVPLIQGIDDSNYDIVFLPWVLSEMKTTAEIRILLQRAADTTRNEGYTIITDRIEENLIDQISKHVTELGAYYLIEENRECKSYAGILFPDELKEIFKPKLNYQTAYWVLLKC